MASQVESLGANLLYVLPGKINMKPAVEGERKERIAVIGSEANKELFGSINSVGRYFSINGKDYKVAGILKFKNPENMGPAEAITRETLGKSHSSDEYSIIKQQDMLDTFNSIMGMLNTALGGIAGISLAAVIVSLAFTFIIGMFFGVYPALRALKLDPIEALRTES